MFKSETQLRPKFEGGFNHEDMIRKSQVKSQEAGNRFRSWVPVDYAG